MLGQDSRASHSLLCLYFPVSSDDQVRAYIKKIMSQLNKWMVGGKISKLVVVITDKETGDHVERWQFDVRKSTELPKLVYALTHNRSSYSTSPARKAR